MSEILISKQQNYSIVGHMKEGQFCKPLHLLKSMDFVDVNSSALEPLVKAIFLKNNRDQ